MISVFFLSFYLALPILDARLVGRFDLLDLNVNVAG